LRNPPDEPSDDCFPRNILCRGFGRLLARALYTVVAAITSRVWIRCAEMPTSAPSALHKALRHSRIAGPARDARAVTFSGVHSLGGLGKISRSKQYRLGTPPPPCRSPLSMRMSQAWRIVPFNLEESFHWPDSHLHLLFHWLVHGCQEVPVWEMSLTYMP